MRRFAYSTVDVFTKTRFGGNPLAVVLDADGLSGAEMQALAAEFNYSETTFVLRAADPAHTARVRIFNRAHEMPFAGHPNVGTAIVLAGLGRDRDGVLRFEELAGLVEVTVQRDGAGGLLDATIAAPQPLSVGLTLAASEVAPCLGLAPGQVRLTAHAPVVASVGVAFVLVEVEADALSCASPDLQAFRICLGDNPALDGRLSILAYARGDGARWRARMFAPLSGTHEDPATGSANAALAALLLSVEGGESCRFEVTQGVEMGRPSLLHVAARHAKDGIRATVAGSCVPVFRGEILL